MSSKNMDIEKAILFLLIANLFAWGLLFLIEVTHPLRVTITGG